MSNTHTQWRIDFARQLAGRLAAFEGIKAIIIAGSVARDYADAYSDLEIPIFWETLPPDAARLAIAAGLQAEFLYPYDGPGREDQLLIHGLQVDLWHIPVRHQEEILEEVLKEYRSDLGSLNALDTLRFCIPLHGHELIRRWKERAQHYPDELAQRIMREHLASFGIGELFIHAQRDNPTAFHGQLSFLQQEIFLVLLALNRRYFPTYKWLYRVLESMPLKPQAIESRFRQAYQDSYADAIADTRSILEETYQLVKRQHPQIEAPGIERRLSYMRAGIERPVSL